MDEKDKKEFEKLFDDPNNWVSMKIPKRLYDIFERHYPPLLENGHLTDANHLARLLLEVGAKDPDDILKNIKHDEAKRIKARNRKMRNLLEKEDALTQLPLQCVDYEIKHGVWQAWDTIRDDFQSTSKKNLEYFLERGVTQQHVIATMLFKAKAISDIKYDWYLHYFVKNKDNPTLDGKAIQKKNPNYTSFHTLVTNRLRSMVKSGIFEYTDLKYSDKKQYSFPSIEHEKQFLKTAMPNAKEHKDYYKSGLPEYMPKWSFNNLRNKANELFDEGMPSDEAKDIITKFYF